MRFKVDENLPIDLADLLTGLGHDGKTVNDELLQGVSDPRLIEHALSGKAVILATLDVDFSDIRAYPPKDHEGIIENATMKDPIDSPRVPSFLFIFCFLAVDKIIDIITGYGNITLTEPFRGRGC